MRILVIDQCSKSKQVPDWFEPYDREALLSHTREELLSKVGDGVPGLPAKKLYIGRQQGYITNAIAKLEEVGDTVDRVFVSAGFGVVDDETMLPPYEATFSGLPVEKIDERSRELGIHDDISSLLDSRDTYDVVFFALGQDYYRAIDLRSLLDDLPASTFVAQFNHEDLSAEYDNVVSLPARTEEAKEHGTVVLALKGQYLQNFADHRSNGRVVNSLQDLYDYCTSEYSTQSGLTDFDP